MPQLLDNLGIDFKILLAQIVNFVLLFLIFKKFLAKPIANVLKKRKELVDKVIRDSKDLERRIAEIDKIREEEIRKAREEYSKILEKAKISAQEASDKIILQAKDQADRIISEAKSQALAQKAAMKEGLKKELEDIFIKALSSILRKEYDSTQKTRIMKEFEEVFYKGDKNQNA